MPEALRLYIFSKNLKFAALPVAGGLYDQHPDLIEQWSIIMEEEGLRQKQEADKREAEARRNKVRQRRR